MGYGGFKRSTSRFQCIGMNPLMVLGGLGKLIDALLRHRDPTAFRHLLTHTRQNRLKRLKNFHSLPPHFLDAILEQTQAPKASQMSLQPVKNIPRCTNLKNRSGFIFLAQRTPNHTPMGANGKSVKEVIMFCVSKSPSNE